MYELVGWIDEGCAGKVVGLRAGRKAGLETEQGNDKMEGSMGGLMDGEGADRVADCWGDILAGLVTDRGVVEQDCLMVGMVDGGWLNGGISAGLVG